MKKTFFIALLKTLGTGAFVLINDDFETAETFSSLKNDNNA